MRQNFIKLLMVATLLVSTLRAVAGVPGFQYITSKEGISQSEVYAFLKDSRGFMWFGTVDGLNRYDGYNIDKFNTDATTKNSLINNTIRSLLEDKVGRVWIGTDYGLNLYDPACDVILQVETTLEQDAIRSIAEHDGNLLVGMPSGLWVASLPDVITPNITLQFSSVHLDKYEDEETVYVKKIVRSRQGGLWIVATGRIYRVVYNNSSQEYIVAESIGREIMPSAFSAIVSLAETPDGNLWIISESNGLLIYDIEKQRMRTFDKYGTSFAPSSNKCSSIAVDVDGNIWIGTLDAGLNRVKAEDIYDHRIHFEHICYQHNNPHSLNSNLIYSLYCTDNGQLWVGTIGSGVNIYDSKKNEFAHYCADGSEENLVNSNFVRSIAIESDDTILFGTHANGLLRLNTRTNKYTKIGFESSSVFHILHYEGRKYIISSGVGIYLVEIKGDNMRVLDQLCDSSTFYAAWGEEDHLWIATFYGLLHAYVKEDRFHLLDSYSEGSVPRISKDICRVIYYDRYTEKLFVGTEGGGLNILTLNDDHKVVESKILKQSGAQGSISSNFVRSIISDSKNNIWIGTYEGLNRLLVDKEGIDSCSFVSYTIKDGLPNNMIQSITEDFDGHLWIATNGGLSKFDVESEKIVNFSISDGIQSNEFSEHTACRKVNGEIYIGGVNGITIFNSKSIASSEEMPNTTITRFFLSNREVKVGSHEQSPLQQNIVLTDRITLEPKQTSIGFEFSAMLYPNSSNIKYSYKLDGFDTEWHTTDAKGRIANYTNLRHGHYTFLVRSTNADGVWEKRCKSVEIHIKTPIYITWWALTFYIIFGLSVLSYTIHLYVARKRLRMVRDHANKVHELDDMRTRFFINISHDLRTPLTLIREPLNILLDDREVTPTVKSRLELIMRNVKRLNYLVEQLLDTRKAEMGNLEANLQRRDIVAFIKEELSHFSYAISQKRLNLNVVTSAEEIMVDFDSNMLSKVMFNIVSNALKYTDSGSITVAITRSSASLSVVVEVTDTGAGMNQELAKRAFERFYQGAQPHDKGYGIGLSHSKELIDAHHGQIEIDSHERVGTTVSFTIPDSVDKRARIGSYESSSEDLYVQESAVEQSSEILPDAKTILIVEDNADMCNFMREEIGKFYNVITAKDGVEGFNKAVEALPDLIISDLLMPNMDGMAMHERLKSTEETRNIIFVFITAKDDLQTKYQGFEVGADEYLTKPFDMKYLLIRIDNLLSSRERLKQMYERRGEFVLPNITVSSADDEFMKKLFEYINSGLADPNFSIASLETVMSMSHTNFYRKIKALTGQSGQELLLNVRMKLAYQILQDNPSVRVSEVAYMVGFTNPKYFSKRFKETYGVSPNSIAVKK